MLRSGPKRASPSGGPFLATRDPDGTLALPRRPCDPIPKPPDTHAQGEADHRRVIGARARRCSDQSGIMQSHSRQLALSGMHWLSTVAWRQVRQAASLKSGQFSSTFSRQSPIHPKT